MDEIEFEKSYKIIELVHNLDIVAAINLMPNEKVKSQLLFEYKLSQIGIANIVLSMARIVDNDLNSFYIIYERLNEIMTEFTNKDEETKKEGERLMRFGEIIKIQWARLSRINDPRINTWNKITREFIYQSWLKYCNFQK